MVPPLKAPATTPEFETIKKLNTVAKWLGARTLEWQPGILMLILMLMTRRNGFFLGHAGAGKSQILRDLMACLLGFEKFQDQMHPEKAVRDLVGYLDIPKYAREGKVHYVISPGNTLVMNPGIGWLGEIWLANGSVLNALLGIANEGDIKLGEQTFKTQVLLVGDGNDMPDVVNVADGDVKRRTLVALADRFLLRMRVRDYVRHEKSQLTLCGLEPDKARGANPPETVTEPELMAVTRLVYRMITGDDNAAFPLPVKKKYLGVIEGLRKNGIPVSDRRLVWGREVLAASALLRGATAIEEVDLKKVQYFGWLSPAHIPPMMEVLQDAIEMAQPKVVAEETACGRVYQDLLDKAKEQNLMTDPTKAVARHTMGSNVAAQLKDSIRKLDSLLKKHPDESEEIEAVRDKIRQWNVAVHRDFLGVDMSELEKA